MYVSILCYGKKNIEGLGIMKKLFLVLSVMMVKGFCAMPDQGDAGEPKTPLDHMREVNQKELQEKSALPDEIKRGLLIILNFTLSKPFVSIETAHSVLKNCTTPVLN